ncbi:MAG: hypothetical protein AAGJ73_08700 [Pseudomonadota bacterium]
MRKKNFLVAAALAALIACSQSDEPAIEAQSDEPTLPAIETEPLSEPDAPVYVGVWAAQGDWCDIAPGSADPSPIAFTEGEFIGYENLCRIGYAEEGTEGGWRMEFICESEGVEYTDVVDLDVDGEMLRLTRADAPETVFVRCKAS